MKKLAVILIFAIATTFTTAEARVAANGTSSGITGSNGGTVTDAVILPTGEEIILR